MKTNKINYRKIAELLFIKHLITEVYTSGIASIVADSFNLWDVISFLPALKDIIMNRDGKVVIRPDSGCPVKILCGNPESNNELEKKGVIECLWDIFGGEINSKGYKQLDSHIGAIYGDAITIERCNDISENLKQKGFASTNVVYGIGSYTYQYNTRDTFGMAMKATFGIVDGEERNIWKDPVTDDGLKKSAKGRLMVDENYNLHEEVSEEDERKGLLKTVFLDGAIVNEISLNEIRNNLKEST
jgi:nicotinamide phosphoribosyltransferase